MEEKTWLSNVGTPFHIYTESFCIGGESNSSLSCHDCPNLWCSVVKLAKSKVILTAGMDAV